MPRQSKAANRVFQLRVSLQEVEPPIWRRLLVPSNITLAKLHATLQEAMGWTFSHLHMFEIRDRRIGNPREDEDGEMKLEDEKKVKLDQLVGEGQALRYVYDFGDDWQHEVRVERPLEPDPRLHYPLCIAGARACPPEDVGGVGGYAEFLTALRDTRHDDHSQMLAWCGGMFDPEGFDVNAVNRALRRLR